MMHEIDTRSQHMFGFIVLRGLEEAEQQLELKHKNYLLSLRSEFSFRKQKPAADIRTPC